MEAKTFEIVLSQPGNPNNQAVLLAALGVFICIMVIGLILYLKYPEKISQSLAIFLSVTIGLGSAWSVKNIDEHRNPSAYTSHITCMYTLKHEKEFVQISTLVPRTNMEVVCSPTGTQVIRVKTDKSVDYYRPFEIPN